jgi:hypothetical protein
LLDAALRRVLAPERPPVDPPPERARAARFARLRPPLRPISE